MVEFVNRLAGATPRGCPLPSEHESRFVLGQARGPAPTGGNSALTAEPAGLYVHVPFCRSKCRYCGFYSVPVAGRETGRLVAALLRELDRYDGVRVLHGLYRRGQPYGSACRTIARAGSADSRSGSRRVEEFTVECNPGQVEAELLAGLRRAGVNRLSFGAQSFRAAELELLGRGHTRGGYRPGCGAGAAGGV